MTFSSPVAALDLHLHYGRGWAASQAGDYATALKEWKPVAMQGHAQAQYNLGVMYRVGQGVLQDYKEAVKWYKLAAKQGHASAQYNLAFMYGTGKGVLQDNTMAHMWYNIGSVKGHEAGGRLRDKIAKKMTPEAVDKAQAMARKCMSSNYTKCGY